MSWRITFHGPKLEEEILALPAGFVARFIRYAERMETYGPDLGMPHTRAMGGGLFELRLSSREGIARVFYCTVVGRRIVMLHQFVKKTDKTPRKELEIAEDTVRNTTTGKVFAQVTMPASRKGIMAAGGLIPYTRTLLKARQ